MVKFVHIWLAIIGWPYFGWPYLPEGKLFLAGVIALFPHRFQVEMVAERRVLPLPTAALWHAAML